MEWSQDFESGLPEIDGQHRDIFALIQRVHVGSDRSGIREVLVELELSTRHHFDCEERLMAHYNYLDLAKHAADHAKLLLEVRGYQDNATFTPRQLNQVLCNWLMSHTMMQDRPLAKHVLQLRASAPNTIAGAEVVGGDEPSPSSAIRSKTGAEDEQASGW